MNERTMFDRVLTAIAYVVLMVGAGVELAVGVMGGL